MKIETQPSSWATRYHNYLAVYDSDQVSNSDYQTHSQLYVRERTGKRILSSFDGCDDAVSLKFPMKSNIRRAHYVDTGLRPYHIRTRNCLARGSTY